MSSSPDYKIEKDTKSSNSNNKCSICNEVCQGKFKGIPGFKRKGSKKTHSRYDICEKCQIKTYLCPNNCGTRLSLTRYVNGHNPTRCKYAKAKLYDKILNGKSLEDQKLIEENNKLNNNLTIIGNEYKKIKSEVTFLTTYAKMLEENNKVLKEKCEIFSDIIQKSKTYIQSDLHPRLARMSLSTCTACRECKQHTVDKHNCTKCRPCDNCKNTIRIVDDKIYMNDEKFNNILHS